MTLPEVSASTLRNHDVWRSLEMHCQEQLLRIRQVTDVTALGKATVYRLIKMNLFPHPIRVGFRAVRWRQSDIDAWMARCPTTPHGIPNERPEPNTLSS